VDKLVKKLRAIVGRDSILSEADELLVYECDGLPQHKHAPRAVVFPNSTEETAEVLALLTREGVSFAPRGAGTGLSGGALAVNHGVVIELARMRRILRVDPENRLAVVESGLVNAHLSRAVAPHDLYYAPDPSSQPSCTIGGNIAENAGGIHCLKYGTTTDHVVGARVVLSDGSIVDLAAGVPGYDLLGVFVGSEGTFGIVTEATVRLSPIPPAVRTLLADFVDVDDASRAVSAIIAAGILPSALEMMDNAIIRAVEASVFTAGLPVDAEAVLLVELDGIEAGIDEEAARAESILLEHNARNVHRAADENERKKLWAARKGAFGAVGRLSPDVMIQDAVVPRSRLPKVLATTYRISARHNLQLANVFHAGDGNLHPLICFDVRRGDDLEHVRQAGREIMEACVRAGGSITGEHGVGLDKSGYLPLIFSEADMEAMLQVRAAFDPSGLCNPGKIIPAPRGCGEARAIATTSMLEPEAGNGTEPAAATAPGADRRPHSGSSSGVLDATGSVVDRENIVGDVHHQAGAYEIPNVETRTAAQTGRPAQRHLRIAVRLNEERIARELADLVGEKNARRGSASNLIAASQTKALNVERTLEVAPASSEKAREVIKLAKREQLAVVPAGAATWLDTGNPMRQADVILSTRRMKRIIRHEPADLVATVHAGATLVEFQERLAKAGQWLPIDPPDDGRATIGGVVATGLGGAQSLGYGTPRSFVIGMRVLLADGRLIKVGGNVVKNVAGYDLCKLFTGSFGTLGLITEVTFKLRPIPAETRTVIASGPVAGLLQGAHAVISNRLSPVALELVSPRLAVYLDPEQSASRHSLLIRIAGSPQAVVSQAAHALGLLRKESIYSATISDADTALWRELAALPMQFADKLSWRAAMLASDLPEFLEEVVQLEADDASHPLVMWQAGVGDGRLRVMARPAVYHREAVRELERLRQKVEDLGGSLVVESAPREIKNEFDGWGEVGSALELMRRIKQQLDPQEMFSPGRFVAGI
jgi:glycolate oxidase subunit GlcD